MTRWPLLVVATALAAVTWFCWPSEERAVRARVTALVEALNAAPGESDLQRIARAAGLASALAPDVVVSLDRDRRLEGREAVLGMARQFLQTRRGSRVAVNDLDVALGPDRTTATATLVLQVDDGVHEARLQLVKPDRVWLVQRADALSPLARPDIGP